MQTLPVILAIFAAAAVIVVILLWRLKPQAAPNTDALDKRIAEEVKRAEALQAKLDANEAASREALIAASVAMATTEAANLRASAAETRANQAKIELESLQCKYNDVQLATTAANQQKIAAEEARNKAEKQLTDALQKCDILQEKFTVVTEKATIAQSDANNKRTQINDLSHTVETLELALASERKELAIALAKQQSDEASASQFKVISQEILGKTLEEAKRGMGELAASLHRTGGEELSRHAEKVALTLEPIQEQLHAYDAAVRNFQIGSIESHASLKEQLGKLHETERNLGDQARALTTALSSTPKYKGTYGELALERLMEHAGLQEGPHYEKQARRNTEDGLKIPDMVVKMPGNQKVIVDAKAVIGAYVAAQETQDDTERNILLKKHCENVRARVVELSAKNYFADHPDAVELVVLFLPAEPLYVAAVENDHGLADFALSRNVILCGPSLLIMLLKSASQLWRRASIEEEAQKIKNCGDAIYEAACSFIQRYADLGTKIEQLENAYNEAAGTLNRTLIPKGRNMGKFASMASSKEVKEIDQLKDSIKPFSSPEAKKLLAVGTEKLPGLSLGEFTTVELTLAAGDE